MELPDRLYSHPHPRHAPDPPLPFTTALSRWEETGLDGVPRRKETTSFTQMMARELHTLCVTTIPPCLCRAVLRLWACPRACGLGPTHLPPLGLLPVLSGYARSSATIHGQTGTQRSSHPSKCERQDGGSQGGHTHSCRRKGPAAS